MKHQECGPYATWDLKETSFREKSPCCRLLTLSTSNLFQTRSACHCMVKDWGHSALYFSTLATWDSRKGFQLVYQALLLLHSCPYFILPGCSSPPPANKTLQGSTNRNYWYGVLEPPKSEWTPSQFDKRFVVQVSFASETCMKSLRPANFPDKEATSSFV